MTPTLKTIREVRRGWARALIAYAMIASGAACSIFSPSDTPSHPGGIPGSNPEAATTIGWSIVDDITGQTFCISTNPSPCTIAASDRQSTARVNLWGSRKGRRISGTGTVGFYPVSNSRGEFSFTDAAVFEGNGDFVYGFNHIASVPGEFHFTARLVETGPGLSQPNVLSFDSIVTVAPR